MQHYNTSKYKIVNLVGVSLIQLEAFSGHNELTVFSPDATISLNVNKANIKTNLKKFSLTHLISIHEGYRVHIFLSLKYKINSLKKTRSWDCSLERERRSTPTPSAAKGQLVFRFNLQYNAIFRDITFFPYFEWR